jgi:hypothetical protein
VAGSAHVCMCVDVYVNFLYLYVRAHTVLCAHMSLHVSCRQAPVRVECLVAFRNIVLVNVDVHTRSQDDNRMLSTWIRQSTSVVCAYASC